ncbi:MAG: adenine deaminase [Deltaproteobacteria bacterium]|nr:adenine deaminase [Deltaproteobacteria bacterium]
MDSSSQFEVSGQIVDLVRGEIFPGTVRVSQGRIDSIGRNGGASGGPFILPGLVDAHVHIESSMLPPSEFARLAVVHGTVATVSDPHEIANVLGVEGVDYMIADGLRTPLITAFGCPSCVPATLFESAGAVIGVEDVRALLARDEVRYLSEMMNFPGVLSGNKDVLSKIEAARSRGKPVDGHAPGLRGADAKAYIEHGITTDHECFTYEEALEKISYGMKIIIREGSAAKNFDALIPLIKDHPEKVMFCSDDKHPNDLLRGHINELVRRAVSQGYSPLSVLKAATLNPVQHYGLDVGLLQPGDRADFILVDALESFNVLRTVIKGRTVAEEGRTLLPRLHCEPINRFAASPITPSALACTGEGGAYRVIEALDGQLITKELHLPLKSLAGVLQSDPERDILKITVINRYSDAPPAVAFVRNFGLKRGAIASSVAHDSHNIIAVGADDSDIARAINLVIENRGGISFSSADGSLVVGLPIAGLMSLDEGEKVASDYEKIDRMVKEAGSTLSAPFMTLSFLALLVIPQLKLSDKGLFDGSTFRFVTLKV